MRLQLVRSWLGIETTLGSVGVGSKYKAGQVFWLRLQTLGSSIQAKSWADGKAEPASWQISVVDLTPLVGGSVGFGAHAGSGLSNSVEIVADDFSATDPGAAGSIAPCPGGTASYSGLALGGHVFRVRASAASNQVTRDLPVDDQSTGSDRHHHVGTADEHDLTHGRLPSRCQRISGYNRVFARW